MRQRVALARAFVVEPMLLLADEAFGHLDEVTSAALRKTFVELARTEGNTAVVVTHQLEEAIELGGRILVLRQARTTSSPTSILRTYPAARLPSLRADIQQMLQSNAPDPEITNLTGKALTMTIDPKAVLDHIDADELVKVTLDLAQYRQPHRQRGSGGRVRPRLAACVRASTRARSGSTPTAPTSSATLPGTSGGRSLCFNSHMDTTIHKDEWWTTRHAADPIFHTGWREGDVLIGNGVCNCKGPMATWLLAAKAIKDAGVKLKGDLVLMSVVGEIGLEPVDEFQPPEYLAKEAGTRYAITHGGVADYALVSEGTDFGIVGVEAGKAFFKITVFGDDLPIYTPYIQRPMPIEKNPSAIIRMSKMIQAVEEWAVEYEQKNRYECAGGTVVPKVNIGAIRGGVPWKITKTVQQCAIYVDVRITPVQEPLDVREELRRLMAEAGLTGEVELYVFRPAFEADEKKAAPLRQAITRAHRAVVGGEPKQAAGRHFEHVARSQLLQRDAHSLADLWAGRERRRRHFPHADRDPDHWQQALRHDRAGPVQPGSQIGERAHDWRSDPADERSLLRSGVSCAVRPAAH